MESAAELHQARILRGRIEALEAQLAAGGGEAAPARAELEALREALRRVLSLQADLDFQRRRALWRLEARNVRRRAGSRACA